MASDPKAQRLAIETLYNRARSQAGPVATGQTQQAIKNVNANTSAIKKRRQPQQRRVKVIGDYSGPKLDPSKFRKPRMRKPGMPKSNGDPILKRLYE